MAAMCFHRRTQTLECCNFLVAVLTSSCAHPDAAAGAANVLLLLLPLLAPPPLSPHLQTLQATPPSLLPSTLRYAVATRPHPPLNGHSICLKHQSGSLAKEKVWTGSTADFSGTASVVCTTSAFLFPETQSKKRRWKSKQSCSRMFVHLCGILGRHSDFLYLPLCIHHSHPLELFTELIITFYTRLKSFFVYLIFIFANLFYCITLFEIKNGEHDTRPASTHKCLTSALQSHSSTSASRTMILQS